MEMLLLTVVSFVSGIVFTLAIAPRAAQWLAPAPQGAPSTDLLAHYRAGVVEHSTDLKVLRPDGSVAANLGRASYWNRNPLKRIAYGLIEKPLVERRIRASNRHQSDLAALQALEG